MPSIASTFSFVF